MTSQPISIADRPTGERQHGWASHPPGDPARARAFPGPSWRARPTRSWPLAS